MLSYLFSAKVAFFGGGIGIRLYDVVGFVRGIHGGDDLSHARGEYTPSMVVIFGRNSEDLVRQKLFYIIRGQKMLLYTTLIKNAYRYFLLILSRCLTTANAFFARTTRKVPQIVIVFGHVD